MRPFDNIEFSILESVHSDQIVGLRRKEYLRYYGRRVVSDCLNWNQTDQNSLHLGFVDKIDKKIVSCLRLSLFQSKEKLELSTLLPTPAELQPTYGLIARAACDMSHSRIGLHSILRCRALEICRELGVTSILGTTEASAAQLNSLIGIGCRILGNTDRWGDSSTIRNSGDVLLIGIVNAHDRDLAIEKLRQKYRLSPIKFDSSLAPMIKG
ncbi:MAG: hypothetical protein IPJ71_16000 [Bdellovibrionales bacterium]|nr:hypothetical protein [Bdellovibrionales bacterium]